MGVCVYGCVCLFVCVFVCLCVCVCVCVCLLKATTRHVTQASCGLSFLPVSTSLPRSSINGSFFFFPFLLFSSYSVKKFLCVFITLANLERSRGRRQITPNRISNLINHLPLEGISLPMNNYSNPVKSRPCQNVATAVSQTATVQ